VHALDASELHHALLLQQLLLCLQEQLPCG
jgi:hypothetical protein